MTRFFFSVGCLLCLLFPFVLWAADQSELPDRSSPVSVEAEQLFVDEETGHYRASGAVYLHQDGTVLHSDELVWDRSSGEIQAQGAVRLERAGEQVFGRSIRYNLDTDTGLIEDGRVFLAAQNLTLRGARIEKTGQDSFRIIDGQFTTCDGDNPAWSFRSQRLDVTVGGYARARHARFYLSRIPVFYLPYMIYPAKTERESGLLIPRLGYSDQRGMEYSGAYYQVISRNQDATYSLDYLSELGVGQGLEYRYLFGRDNAGQAKGYYIAAAGGEDRQAASWRHTGTLPGDFRLSADTEYVSADDYFSDFGDEADEYNKDQTVSTIALSRKWQRYNLVGQIRYSDDLAGDDPDTLQMLPQLSLDAARRRIGGSVLFSALRSDYTYFWREEGLTGQRLQLRPLLLAEIDLWRAATLVPELGWTERHYWLAAGDRHLQHGQYDFAVGLSSQLYRTYGLQRGKLRHALEPEVRYAYVPQAAQDDLPEFDSVDRIDAVKQIDYGLSQTITVRSDSPDRASHSTELLWLRISQGYDLLVDGTPTERLTPLRGQLTLLPDGVFSFDVDTQYDLSAEQFVDYRGQLQLADQSENSLAVQYVRDKSLDEESDYGQLDLAATWLQPVYLHYRNRYDFATSEFLEQVVDMEYRHQCWSLLLSLRDREDDRSVMLTFALGGIGPVGSIGAQIDSQ
ncbi:MAG: hypothetical protein C0618_05165 [Desulfuromonas sp.]|nr:MAG: hypothetical protein C0618_05165 [Desulfuromonas sp.]